MDKYMKAIERQGRFGRLFVDYAGCPRGPMGRMAGVSLVDEALAMPEISDVDGGRWIPVQADALHELCDLATSRWINVKERLPKAFEPVIVCRAGAEQGSVKVEQGCLDVNAHQACHALDAAARTAGAGGVVHAESICEGRRCT